MLRTALATLAASLSLATAVPVGAQALGDILSVELLPGWKTDRGTHMAAVRMRLANGWKTYWRSPGDAGIPPEFDWAGSENLRGVRLHWPTPEVFTLNGMQTVGYARELVLPVEVWPENTGSPVRLEASVHLGVCRDICVPAQVDIAGLLAPPGTGDAAIRAALGARPKTAREGGVKSHACQIDPSPQGLSLTAMLDMPRLGAAEVVVVETADARIWVSEATTRRTGGRLKAQVDLVSPSRAPFALDRSGLTITVLADGRAVEISGCPAP